MLVWLQVSGKCSMDDSTAQSKSSSPHLSKILKRATDAGPHAMRAKAYMAGPASPAPQPQPPITKMDVLARLRQAHRVRDNRHGVQISKVDTEPTPIQSVSVGNSTAATSKQDLYQKLLQRGPKHAAGAVKTSFSLSSRAAHPSRDAREPQKAGSVQPSRSPNSIQDGTESCADSPSITLAGGGIAGTTAEPARFDGIADGYVIVSQRSTCPDIAPMHAVISLQPLVQQLQDQCRPKHVHGDQQRSAINPLQQQSQAAAVSGFVLTPEQSDNSPAQPCYDGCAATAGDAQAYILQPKCLQFISEPLASPSNAHQAQKASKHNIQRGRATSAGRNRDVTRWGGSTGDNAPLRKQANHSTTPTLPARNPPSRILGRNAGQQVLAKRAAPAPKTPPKHTRRAISAPAVRRPARKPATKTTKSPWVAHELTVGEDTTAKWRTSSVAVSSAASSPNNGEGLANAVKQAAKHYAAASPGHHMTYTHLVSTEHQHYSHAQCMSPNNTATAFPKQRRSVASSRQYSPGTLGVHRRPATASSHVNDAGSHVNGDCSLGSSPSCSPARTNASSHSVSPTTRMRGYATVAAALLAGATLSAVAADAGINGHTTSTHHAQPSIKPDDDIREAAPASPTLVSMKTCRSTVVMDDPQSQLLPRLQAASPERACTETDQSSEPSDLIGNLRVNLLSRLQAASTAKPDGQPLSTAPTVSPSGLQQAPGADVRPYSYPPLQAVPSVSPRVQAGRPKSLPTKAAGTGSSVNGSLSSRSRATEDMSLSNITAISVITKKPGSGSGGMQGDLVGLSAQEVLRRTLRRDGPAPRASPVRPHAATMSMPPHLVGFRGPGGAASYAAHAAAMSAASSAGCSPLPRYATATASSAARASPQAHMAIILSKGSPGSSKRKGTPPRGKQSSASSSPGHSPFKLSTPGQTRTGVAVAPGPPAPVELIQEEQVFELHVPSSLPDETLLVDPDATQVALDASGSISPPLDVSCQLPLCEQDPLAVVVEDIASTRK